jgi:hypothetical protein
VVHMFLCTQRRWVVFDKNMVQMIGRFGDPHSIQPSSYVLLLPMRQTMSFAKMVLCPSLSTLIAPTLSSSL